MNNLSLISLFGFLITHVDENGRCQARFPLSKSNTWEWVEFVVGSLLCSKRFFVGTPDFPSPQKPTFPNSKSTRNQVDEEPLCGCATSKSLFIYYLFMSGYTKNIATSSLPQVPLLLKDWWYFLLSRTAYWGKLFVWFVPVHFLHASITVSYHLSGQKLLCRKARNTFDPFKEKEYISKW